MSAEGMPATLLELFVARPPLQFLKAAPLRPHQPISCLASFVDLLDKTEPPPVEHFETPKERWARVKIEKEAAHKKKLKKLIAEYDPHRDGGVTRDPFSTLFVGRISYETTEKKLRKEFEVYGQTRKVRLIKDKNGKPRGYAFIEFEHERDMKTAYKHGDGKKIDNRRVVVDVERGRTVRGWLPRRLGGGRGPKRFVPPKLKGGGASPGLNLAMDRRPPPSSAPPHSGPPMFSGPPSSSFAPSAPPFQQPDRNRDTTSRIPRRDDERPDDRHRSSYRSDRRPSTDYRSSGGNRRRSRSRSPRSSYHSSNRR
eukprot:Lankesteria_metandrocarpae@DN2547_c0_g1_i1.p1